ncbi:SRPBCC family protein [Lysobacter sp. A3-1-A15]|uniref:SRPBCC family protein n=1 Tax=Novilysobacter viscosus TaxID=3098602 RepID=UPI002EDA0515
MTRLIEILISLAIVAALFLVVGVLLPSSRHHEESVETNRKLTIVYDTISSLRRFEDWHPLVLRDPSVEIEKSGPESGVGSRLDYTSDTALGEGSWELVSAEPRKSVTFELTDPEPGINKRTTYSLRPTGRAGRNVEITQTYDVDYGWNLIGRYAGMYVSSNVGADMKLGLQRLSNMLAAVPNYDYSELSKDDPEKAPRLQDRPAENLLFVSAAVPRDNEAVAKQMTGNMEWIRRVMAANNLEAAGPVRIITNEFGAESYSFDVAVPVRKRSGGASPDADEDEGSEDGEAAEVETEVAAVDAPELTGLKLDGPVEYLRSPASKVAMVPFTGHMANLAMVRDALRAWALTQGFETAERPYEVWKSGIEGGFMPDGEFEVYWAVR